MSERINHVRYEFECGSARWRVLHVRLREELSRPFRAEIRALCEGDASVDALWHEAGELTLARDDRVRVFRGSVVQAQLSKSREGTIARLRFMPKLACLGWSARHRIFQDVDALEVIERILGVGGDVRLNRASVSRQTLRDYLTQYDESDLAFCARVLEDLGMAWNVDDGDDEQLVRLLDNVDSFLRDPDLADLRLIPSAFDEASSESVQSLEFIHNYPAAPVVEREWRWTEEPSVVEARFPTGGDDIATHEMFALRRAGVEDVEGSVRREYERRAASDALGRGRANAIAIRPGRRMTVTGPQGETVELAILAVTHVGHDPAVGETAPGPNYVNTFACKLADAPYRAQRTPARPKIQGTHTAVVVGPPGEEIHTDEHGRIKVRMQWDRSDTADADASCWLRVAQSWAGSGWGSVVIPRVGMEVLVTFLDGDPDRPMCIGCVYNGANTPPYPLPDEKTKTTLRSNSSPGGDGFNELTFEDRKDAEQVFLHAQRDLVEKVKRNETMSIGSDRGISVGRNDTLSVGGDQKVTVDGNQTLNVKGGGKQGTLGTEVAITGSCNITVTDPGKVLIDAQSSIELRCGASKIMIDTTSIRIFAGSGAYTNLDTAIFSQSSVGASTELKEAVTAKSMHGGAFVLDGKVSSTSADGASVVIDKEVTAKAIAGAQLTLNADAALGGAKVSVESGQGSWLVLDASADLGGAMKTTCSGPGGQIEVAATGVTIDGSQVEINGAAKVAMLAPLVSAN